MATVFRAYDANLDCFVAIKVMHQAFSEDPAFLSRFQREAQIVARLRHPHLVTIYEFDQHQGQPYLVMEFIKGETLKARLKNNPPTLAETIAILKDVSAALTYAHQQGVLHRDIKPSNILLDENNVPYLTDFGLARMVQAGESTLSQDMLLGTPQYISPEQAQGMRELGPATDIYSLGIVAYELIVGRVPFSADTPYAIVHDHIYKPLPLPSAVNPAVPPGVERVLLKALAKEPQDRYSTAAEMVDALEQAVTEAEMDTSIVHSTLAATHPGMQMAPFDTAIPAPAPPPIATPGQRQPAPGTTRRGRRNLWAIGGLGAFTCICLVALGIAAGIVSNPDLSGNALTTATVLPDSQASPVAIPVLSVSEARDLVAVNPDDPAANFALALALLKSDQRLLAQEALRRAMRVSADSPEYILLAAREAVQSGYMLEALQLLAEAMEQSDTSLLRNEAGAFMYEFAERATRAQTATFSRFLSARPDSALAHVMLARAYIASGQLSLAEQEINSALEIDGALPEAHLVLGELHAAAGDYDSALTEWQFAATSADAPPWIINAANRKIAEVTG